MMHVYRFYIFPYILVYLQQKNINKCLLEIWKYSFFFTFIDRMKQFNYLAWQM